MPISRRKLDLPAELEREVFEMAAKVDIGTALRLALVARRVQTWIEPIIYARVVVARPPDADDAHWQRSLGAVFAARRRAKAKTANAGKPRVLRFIRTVPLRPASFFARHVKVLHVGNLTEPELITVLSTCTGISELGWWSCNPTAALVPALNLTSLRRLSVDQTYDFNLPGMNNHWTTITHLDITAPAVRTLSHQHELPPLARFPALTHLSFMCDFYSPLDAWGSILKACPRLKILLHLSTYMHQCVELLSNQERSDPRIVVMPPPVSSRTASWVHDVWPVAEEIVRERGVITAAEKKAASIVDVLDV
ncbi:hypothetical protein GGX14DRAFT_479244 [Mycena pura]|uniref:F-box domain-containing protein n=1 Tax=Mycena pura TaxID=153505 RepID=A0AAD6Y615_9AGAR|nr:hypothetical protein GGX14DRAFT_479244 [Mycena pura]